MITTPILFEPKIDREFRAFDAKHPEVYRLFRKLAERMRSQGHKKYSARTILEVMRWEFDLEHGDQADGWKLNNNYTPLFARKLMGEAPEFVGFFELRERKAGGS